MKITDYRNFQIYNSEKILDNIVKYVMYKKNSKVNVLIDDDISCFTTTKGYNEGKRVCFYNDERTTNIFVPLPVLNDFYTYKMIPRIIQSSLVDDIFYFHPSYIKCDIAKFYYKKDKTNEESLIKGCKALWLLSTNYNVMFTPHLFTIDEDRLSYISEYMDIVEEEYDIYTIDAVINKQKRKIKCFVAKKFIEEVKNTNYDTFMPDVAFVKLLLNPKEDSNFNVQINDIYFEQYALASTVFNNNRDIYLNLINDTSDFRRIYTKNISLAISLFLYFYCICCRKEYEFEKISKLIYGKSSSLKYRYVQSYQQIFIPFEKTVTNVLRKISKFKKVKTDEITNLATEVSRLSTLQWNDIYNPYTEMRVRTSMTLPFKDLSDEMRELDKSMYGIVCPIDTGDKDPGKVVRATENMRLDEVGRTQSSFRYNEKLMLMFSNNQLRYGHPFIDRYFQDKLDVASAVYISFVDNIDFQELNDYDTQFSYFNEIKIFADEKDEITETETFDNIINEEEV